MMESILNTQPKPDWISGEDYSFREIKELSERVLEINEELIKFYKFQFLLYGTDISLEKAVTHALDYLGFANVVNHEENKDYADITFDQNKLKYLVEVEGTTKKGDKSKVLQLDGWIRQEIICGASFDRLKGIFIVNHERDEPPDKRGHPLTPHAKEFLKRYNFIFLSTLYLFKIIKKVHYEKISKSEARESIIKGEDIEGFDS